MKALVVNALDRGFDVEDVDIAAPIGREVLVNVQAAGLCHTDLLFATHHIAPTPSVLGHEVAGIVVAVGPDVTHVHVGDHVVGSLAQACGACARCLSGRPFQCQRPETTLRRPDDAPRLSRGGIGLFQGFGLGGFAEQAIIHENRRFGATDVIDSTTSKPVEAVRDLLPGGADHVFDFVGLKLVAEEGLAMLGVGGGLYLVGVSKPDVDISLNIFAAIGGQKRVVGVNFGSTNAKRDISIYAQLYLQGRMNLDDLVSKQIALREVNDGYAALKDGSLNRVVVTSF
jgi:S-(hydroxymethyl)glutathione dehydrogenase/alcohol dehydrogenase